MELDKRVEMLSNEQLNSLEPIFEILEKDVKHKYSLIDDKDIYKVQISKPFSKEEEDTLINTYLENRDDENYRTIMEEVLDEALKRNSQSTGLHFMVNNPTVASYYLMRNFKIQRLLKE